MKMKFNLTGLEEPRVKSNGCYLFSMQWPELKRDGCLGSIWKKPAQADEERSGLVSFYKIYYWNYDDINLF